MLGRDKKRHIFCCNWDSFTPAQRHGLLRTKCQLVRAVLSTSYVLAQAGLLDVIIIAIFSAAAASACGAAMKKKKEKAKPFILTTFNLFTVELRRTAHALCEGD